MPSSFKNSISPQTSFSLTNWTSTPNMSTKRSQFFFVFAWVPWTSETVLLLDFQVLPGAPLARGERTGAQGRSGLPSLVSSDRWPPLGKFPLKAKPYGILGIFDLQDGDLRDGYMGFQWVWCKNSGSRWLQKTTTLEPKMTTFGGTLRCFRLGRRCFGLVQKWHRPMKSS